MRVYALACRGVQHRSVVPVPRRERTSVAPFNFLARHLSVMSTHLKSIVLNATTKHTATVIFLHVSVDLVDV